MTKITKNTLFSLAVAAVLSITGCSNSDGNSTSEVTALQYQAAGWYMKTAVSATASDGKVWNHTTAGVFGELLQSDDAKDQHDIPGYGAAILQIVFPQTEWGDDNGDYFTNYQNYDENNNAKRVWTFQIKNQQWPDLSNAPITIKLDGTYDVSYLEENGRISYKEKKATDSTKLDAITLVDVDNDATYSYTELQTANLNMDDLHTRTFRWVLGTVEDEDYAPLPVARLSRSSAFNNSASNEDLEEAPLTISKFGLPPQ